MSFASFRRFGLLTLATAATALCAVEQTHVFVSGRDGYHTFRIPSILRVGEATLLAFCEGRKYSGSDTGDIDLLVKRSNDNGRTWSAAQVVWDDGPNTCGNPCPVVDESDGTIWMLSTHNLGTDKESAINAGTSSASRTVWVMHSKDQGVTWSRPTEITAAVKKPEWTWYATGPGVGIQIQQGKHAGRMVIPCDHNLPSAGKGKSKNDTHFSHAIFSDDHGKTWQLGGIISPRVNECQVVELFDGRGTLMMNLRSYSGWQRRAESFSSDGGLNWTEAQRVDALPDPVCQGSVIRVPATGTKGELYFSNPADGAKRVKMTVRASDDNGKTWARALLLYAGPSAYSCLVDLGRGSVGCFYENGDVRPYERITLASFGASDVSAGLTTGTGSAH